MLRRIREPLRLLSQGRILFLNTEQWICSWVLSPVFTKASQAHSIFEREDLAPASSGIPQVDGEDKQETDKNIERYYFLPADWVTPDDAQSCSIMRDGTLLCLVRG